MVPPQVNFVIFVAIVFVLWFLYLIFWSDSSEDYTLSDQSNTLSDYVPSDAGLSDGYIEEDEDIKDEINLSCLTDKILSENRSDQFEFVDEGTTGIVRIIALHMCCFYLKTEIFAEISFGEFKNF